MLTYFSRGGGGNGVSNPPVLYYSILFSYGLKGKGRVRVPYLSLYDRSGLPSGQFKSSMAVVIETGEGAARW